MPKIPTLPKLLASKIYKTGQTRGADDDVIFQNRVGRNSTVLISYSSFDKIVEEDDQFENGYIVLISPDEYFNDPSFGNELKKRGLSLGENALLFYETRSQWNKFNPDDKGFSFATSRTAPLGGQYVARVPSLTSESAEKIIKGYSNSKLKGAGIRVYEYASTEITVKARIQLELLFWHCENAKAVAKFTGMSDDDIEIRIKYNTDLATKFELDNWDELKVMRIINENKNTICPLCLKPLSANGFFSKVVQAIGREVPDLTITELNLFHIKELRIGEYNHKPYNLGWGHHHCNVVTKDAGIMETLVWMKEVIELNEKSGYKITSDI
ncbi:MAG: BstXI family restriction endonuclease [Mucilaginibacter sp.]|jgi:hypothetical protein|uniref:BstXI family restriction endonuclease n=1 Tax=Mucilaginibacter sp. TaxID=1882438 RepID=UPI003564C265